MTFALMAGCAQFAVCTNIFITYVSRLFVFRKLTPLGRFPSSETDDLAVSHEILRLVCTPKLRYCVHKTAPLIPILSQLNLIGILTLYSFKNCFNNEFAFMLNCLMWSHLLGLSDKFMYGFLIAPVVLHVSPISYSLSSSP